MEKIYITFGQDHIHRVKGKILDKDTVAVLEARDYEAGRKRAFELFERRFCFAYSEEEWDEEKMQYFPSGYVYVD
jgi:hypothetical protein